MRRLLPDQKHDDCNGCGVCMLSCPVWMQHKTQSLTYCGRTRAAAGGAVPEDLASSAKACILCGSCASICPRGIRTQEMTLALRKSLEGLFPRKALPSAGQAAERASSVFIPGPSLRANASLAALTQSLLQKKQKETVLWHDDGQDVLHSLESGVEVDQDRVTSFLSPLAKAREIVVSDGMLRNVLSVLLPQRIMVRSLGRALLEVPEVRNGLRPDDFYMIETRAYNAGRKELAPFYDRLRHETGCFMNLDLHRAATPTGASSLQHREGYENVVDVEAQIAWLLEGRPALRIVAEHLDDAAAFSRYTDLPVLHLGEVAQP